MAELEDMARVVRQTRLALSAMEARLSALEEGTVIAVATTAALPKAPPLSNKPPPPAPLPRKSGRSTANTGYPSSFHLSGEFHSTEGKADRYLIGLEFPDSLMPHIVGSRGKGLKQIHDLSGARVSAFTMGPDEERQRLVSIKGTDRQIGDALIVLGKRIACQRVRVPKKQKKAKSAPVAPAAPAPARREPLPPAPAHRDPLPPALLNILWEPAAPITFTLRPSYSSAAAPAGTSSPTRDALLRPPSAAPTPRTAMDTRPDPTRVPSPLARSTAPSPISCVEVEKLIAQIVRYRGKHDGDIFLPQTSLPLYLKHSSLSLSTSNILPPPNTPPPPLYLSHPSLSTFHIPPSPSTFHIPPSPSPPPTSSPPPQTSSPPSSHLKHPSPSPSPPFTCL
ncbi:hypothetical protein D9615_004787 [Tricholomella constricta]|uniref:K Homology domain-containing protein n=1 Tax=Tricholomella constricta TaxID=117010 RepID=A0A8H5M779_9AGAR|nr:hypothetical protein D9615_004787 [Tricholomella constricta]